MRLNPYIYGILAVVLFLGVIYGAKAGGLWSTSRRAAGPSRQIAVEVNSMNADDVRGSMTFAEVSRAFRIPVADIYAAFNLPADTPPSKQLKDVLRANKIEVDELRDWLKKRGTGAK
ncbi:MAG: hypothetical protein RDU83_10610 [bacterium]|nr:hypothetical protein [bacterium]